MLKRGGGGCLRTTHGMFRTHLPLCSDPAHAGCVRLGRGQRERQRNGVWKKQQHTRSSTPPLCKSSPIREKRGAAVRFPLLFTCLFGTNTTPTHRPGQGGRGDGFGSVQKAKTRTKRRRYSLSICFLKRMPWVQRPGISLWGGTKKGRPWTAWGGRLVYSIAFVFLLCAEIVKLRGPCCLSLLFSFLLVFHGKLCRLPAGWLAMAFLLSRFKICSAFSQQW